MNIGHLIIEMSKWRDEKLGLIVDIVFLKHKNVIEPVLINFLIMSVREPR